MVDGLKNWSGQWRLIGLIFRRNWSIYFVNTLSIDIYLITTYKFLYINHSVSLSRASS